MQPKIKLTPFDVTDHLRTDEDRAGYLEACKDEDPGDGSLMRAALGDVARARVRWQQLPATPADPDSPHTTAADWHGARNLSMTLQHRINKFTVQRSELKVDCSPLKAG